MSEIVKAQDMQSVVLDVYKEFKNICDKHGLRYFAIGGTAIGAVRHNGFIPWDDDIDVAMPRKDYEKFFMVASKELPAHYGCVDCLAHPESGHAIGRMYDARTTSIFAPQVGRYGEYIGVFMDIMPLDGVPSNRLLFNVHMNLLSLLVRLIRFRAYGEYIPIDASWAKKTIKKSVGRFARLFDKKYLVDSFVGRAKKYQFDDQSTEFLSRTWLFGTHDGMKSRARYYKEDFADFIEMPFEDTAMRMPVGYDRYLTSLYPGYMTLPPEHKRVPRHNDGITDLAHSYKYHIAKGQGKIIGYTAGCYDMFHIGHLNLLERAKKKCDYLIVGINSDEAMFGYKNKYPVISNEERMDIVRSLSCVDEVVRVDDTDKWNAYNEHKYDVIFVGDDHKGEKKWSDLEKKLTKVGSKVHYFTHTAGTSSTILREALDERITEKTV